MYILYVFCCVKKKEKERIDVNNAKITVQMQGGKMSKKEKKRKKICTKKV